MGLQKEKFKQDPDPPADFLKVPYEDLLKDTDNGTINLSLDGKISLSDDVFARMLGFSSKEEFLEHDEGKNHVLEPHQVESLLEGKRVFANIAKKNGDPICLECSTKKNPDFEKRLSVYAVAKEKKSKKVDEERLIKGGRYLHAIHHIQKMLLAFRDRQDLFNNIMGELGPASGADRAFLFDIISQGEGPARLDLKAEWCNGDIKPQIGNIFFEKLTYYKDLKAALENKKIFSALVKDLEGQERKIHERNNIRSVLVLPIQEGDRLYGLIGFHDCRRDRIWDEDEIDLLSVAASSIALGMKNEETRKSLAESEKKYKAIFENNGNASVILDKDHNIVLANHEFCRLIKSSAEEIVGRKNLRDFISKEDREFVIENQKMLTERQENAIKNYEIKIIDKEKGLKDVHMTVGIIPNTGMSIASLENISFIKKIAQENKLFKTIIENSNNGIHIVDEDLHISYVNEYLAKTLGYGQLDLIGQDLEQLHLQQQMPYMKRLREGVNNRKSFENEEIFYRHKNGDLVPMMVNGFMMDDAFRNKKYWVNMSTNITKQKEMIERLEESEKWYRTIFETSSSAMAITDEHYNFLFVNDAMSRLTGYPKEILEHKMQSKDLVYFKDLAIFQHYHEKRRLDHQMIPQRYEFRLVDSKKKIKPVLKIVNLIPGTKISVSSLIDISELKEKESKIEYLSFHDSLTGLYNRAYFEVELQRIDTPRNYPISIIMGDLNGLKLVNDIFGYREGDRQLKEIAKILRKACRKQDILCRYGGDEFIILLPKADEYIALSVMERINRRCTNEKNSKIPLSISMGTFTKNIAALRNETLIKEAEDRMFRSKLLESKSNKSLIISSLERALWEKSQETEEHAKRLKKMALSLGRKIGFTKSELDELALLATLHDIGKIATPDEILISSAKINPSQWKIIKKHPETGYRIANSIVQFAPIAESILCHHERWDGKGYPKGLKGEEIPIDSRIISVVDSYDVMVTGRPYKTEMTKQQAIAELLACAGSQFDPQIVELFVEIIK